MITKVPPGHHLTFNPIYMQKSDFFSHQNMLTDAH